MNNLSYLCRKMNAETKRHRILTMAVLFCLLLTLSAQAKQAQVIEPSYSWTMSDPLGQHYPSDIDTTHIDYAQRFVPTNQSIAWATTGNYGAPGQDQIFFDRPVMSEFFFEDAQSAWIPTIEDHQFFNSRIPMTMVSYTTGGGQQATQDRTSALFSGNINRKSAVGGAIDYIYSKGSYDAQADKDFSWKLFGSHMGDRYEFQGVFLNYNLLNKENGGITDDRYITNPAEVQGGDTRVDNKSIPVNLSAAHSKLVGTQIFLNNRFKVGYYKYERDSITDTIIGKTYVPVTSFIYTFDFKRNRHRFINQNASQDETFFENTYLGKGGTDEATTYYCLRNTVGVSMLEGFSKRVKFGFSAYATHEMRKYKLIADTVTGNPNASDDLTPMPFTSGSDYTDHTIYVGGNLIKQQGSLLHYDVSAEFGLTGGGKGEIDVEGEVSTNFKLWKDTVTVRGYGFFKNISNSGFIDMYRSNHYMWENDFDYDTRFRVGGEIDVPFSGTNINVGYETLKNYIYFGEDALPAQCKSPIHVLSATLCQNFHFGPLGWDNKLTYQTSSNETVLSLPKFAIYSNLYFRFTIAKVLHVQIGVDCNYYTKYYAPNYNPATMTFYNQREVKCGNFAYMSAYANFKLKKARFFVMYQHANKGLFGGMNYFSMPHYPLNPGRFQLGVSVDFVN